MTAAEQDFGIYIQENKEQRERIVLLIQKGMTISKIKKLASKQLKTKQKQVKKLYLSSGKEVKFVDELKQDAEVFVSYGELFYKTTDKDEIIEEFKISILGSGGVGKSALTLRFIRNCFVQEWDPTVEDAYSKIFEINSKKTKLSILDTAGQDNFESMRPHWLRDKDGYIFVFALNSSESFQDLDKFVKLHEEINYERNVPIILVGNKTDIKERSISQEIAQNLAKKVNAKYIETSALNGENVEEIFKNIVIQCRIQGVKDLKPILSKCIIM